MKHSVNGQIVLSQPLEGALAAPIASFAQRAGEKGYRLYSVCRRVLLAACFSRWPGQKAVRLGSSHPSMGYDACEIARDGCESTDMMLPRYCCRHEDEQRDILSSHTRQKLCHEFGAGCDDSQTSRPAIRSPVWHTPIIFVLGIDGSTLQRGPNKISSTSGTGPFPGGEAGRARRKRVRPRSRSI